MGIKKELIKINDMTCASCEGRIEKALKNLNGVLYVKASYSKSNTEVIFHEDLCTLSEMNDAIKKAGYSVSTGNTDGITKILGVTFIGVAIVVLGKLSSSYDMNAMLSNATYFMLFVVGLISSIHCVGMCGGIMLSQSISKDGAESKFESIKPALLYNGGRVVSYTILGGLIGTLGSVLSLSLKMKAGMQLFAGLFMIIMGLNMLGLSWFRKIHIKLPWSACSVKQKSKTPFVVGLLNGLMPCGPLQTMQLFALGTGSAIKGAASMLFFAIGTVPLMLTFGTISGLLSKGYTKRLLKFSGILVILLGFVMGNRGLSLSGINLSSFSSLVSIFPNKTISETIPKTNVNTSLIKNNVQVIRMSALSVGYKPNTLVVQEGIPVKWIITGEQLTACNSTIVVPSLRIQKDLNKGENIVEFTPISAGDINFSCSMGMLRGVIKVVNELKNTDTAKIADNAPPANGPSYNSGGNSAGQSTSIYGDDLNKVPAERLVRKASIIDNVQTVSVNGIGYEFDPLIVIFNKGGKAIINMDLNKFTNFESKFNIVDGNNGEIIYSFTGGKGVNELEVPTNKITSYGISKDGNLLCIISIVNDLKTINVESIKKKYIY